jgi:hypothetical protein
MVRGGFGFGLGSGGTVCARKPDSSTALIWSKVICIWASFSVILKSRPEFATACLPAGRFAFQISL